MSGISVPTMDDFNALVARVATLEGEFTSLDQRVTALEESNVAPPPTYAATLDAASGGDDTAMINEKLQLAATNGGGTVYAPGGNIWRHDGLIEVPGGVSLQGDGDGSELRSTNQNGDGWPTLCVHLTGGKPGLKSLKVTTDWGGDRQGTPYAQAVWVDGADGFLIDAVHVDGAAAGGIFCERSNNGTVSNCLIENTRADGIGIGYSGSSYNTAINNTVDNAGDDGISIVSYTDDPQSTGIKILNNTVRNGAFARGIVDVGGMDCEIRGNIVSNIRCAGIFTIQDEYWGTYAPTRTVVDGNAVSNCAQPGCGYAANYQFDVNTTEATATNNVSSQPGADDYAVHSSATVTGSGNQPPQAVTATKNIHPPTDRSSYGKPRPKLPLKPPARRERQRVAQRT